MIVKVRDVTIKEWEIIVDDDTNNFVKDALDNIRIYAKENSKTINYQQFIIKKKD